MSRIPPDLARRIDRAARAAHRFHRFAHHPLCPAYAGEVVALGRWRLCKGCALAGLGALAGALFALFVRPPGWVLIPALLAIAGAGLAGVATAPRLPKLLTRGLPAACAGMVLAGALLRGDGPGWTAALVVGGGTGLGITWYRRRGPWRRPCEACPDRMERPACPGFRHAWRRERALRRLTGAWLKPGPGDAVSP